MLLGVMARDAGDRERAIAYLRKAHEMAPQAPNPALELGFTLEAKHPREARKVYEQILARDPASRPAILGLARVARSQNRLDEARGLYDRLLAVNPKDPEALNGIAWLALAERNREQAQAGFEHVLTIAPDNEEAKIGLSMAPDVYRYLLDTSATMVSTSQGTSWGFGARGMAGITPYDTLELGEYHFTNELQTVTAIGVATLPSDDITVGYHRLVPLSYAVSLVYDYRGHASLPTEHWIEGSVDFYLTDWLRWFGGYRQAFGGFQYDGRLIRTGVSATIAPSWEVTGTVYDSAAGHLQQLPEPVDRGDRRHLLRAPQPAAHGRRGLQPPDRQPRPARACHPAGHGPYCPAAHSGPQFRQRRHPRDGRPSLYLVIPT